MATRITQRGKHEGAHRRARVRTLTAPPLAEGRLRNNQGQIVEGHDDVSQHRDRVFIEVAYRSEQFYWTPNSASASSPWSVAILPKAGRGGPSG
jgi:hypothetical protein